MTPPLLRLMIRGVVTPPPGLDSGDAMPFGTIWAQVGEACVVPRIQRAADATAQDPTVPQYRHP